MYKKTRKMSIIRISLNSVSHDKTIVQYIHTYLLPATTIASVNRSFFFVDIKLASILPGKEGMRTSKRFRTAKWK